MRTTRFGPLLLLATVIALPPGAGAADGDRPGATAEFVNPNRFGGKHEDPAYGAYQRGYYKTAFDLALPLAEKGDKAAQVLVAEILARGLGRKRDEAAAAKWYQAAAEQDLPEAQFQYALLLIDGRFVKRDKQAAFALMEAAADAGNRFAQFNYAQMLVERDPGQKGISAAFPYFEKAAKADLPDAQYAMAQLLTSGAGGRPVDEPGARQWLQRAAQNNFDTAQLDLGTWMINGRGGPRDEKGGFAWLKRAAEGGNVAAQNRLAKLYMQGIGTEPDAIFAAAWYILAHRAGLADPMMDDFMNGLTDDEVKLATGRANKLR